MASLLRKICGLTAVLLVMPVFVDAFTITYNLNGGVNHVRSAIALTGLACSLGFSQDLLYPDMFALSDVQLLDGVLKDRQDLNIETLMSYDVDRLLAPFYEEAGM